LRARLETPSAEYAGAPAEISSSASRPFTTASKPAPRQVFIPASHLIRPRSNLDMPNRPETVTIEDVVAALDNVTPKVD
jgi:hypothetical protein